MRRSKDQFVQDSSRSPIYPDFLRIVKEKKKNLSSILPTETSSLVCLPDRFCFPSLFLKSEASAVLWNVLASLRELFRSLISILWRGRHTIIKLHRQRVTYLINIPAKISILLENVSTMNKECKCVKLQIFRYSHICYKYLKIACIFIKIFKN